MSQPRATGGPPEGFRPWIPSNASGHGCRRRPARGARARLANEAADGAADGLPPDASEGFRAAGWRSRPTRADVGATGADPRAGGRGGRRRRLGRGIG